MIKKAAALQHPSSHADSFPLNEPGHLAKAQHSTRYIPPFQRHEARSSCAGYPSAASFPGQDPGTLTHQRPPTAYPAGSGNSNPFPHLKDRSSTAAKEATESQDPRLPAFLPAADPEVMGNGRPASALVDPRIMVFDNMAVGHFLPLELIQHADRKESRDSAVSVKYEGPLTPPPRGFRPSTPARLQALPAMHLQLFPSPPNSTNSASDSSFHPVSSASQKQVHSFQADIGSAFVPGTEVQNAHVSDNFSPKSTSQVSVDITPSGCTLFDAQTISTLQNDGLGSYLISSGEGSQTFSKLPYSGMGSASHVSTQETLPQLSAQQMKYCCDFQNRETPSAFVVPQCSSVPGAVFRNNVIPQPYSELSSGTSSVSSLSGQVPKENGQSSKSTSLGRFPILPSIASSTPGAGEGDNLSILSYSSSNNGAQINPAWYPPFSPFGNDGQHSIFAGSPKQSSRSSFSGRGSRNKRALSNSPLSAEGIDLNSIIRMSPTSLITYLTGSRSSSSCVSPGSTGEKTGCYGHLSARNSSSSPHSGSGSSIARLSLSQTPKNQIPDISDIASTNNEAGSLKQDFLELDSNMLVLQAMQELESTYSASDHANYLETNDFLQNPVMVPDCDNLRILPQDIASYRADEFLPYFPVNHFPPANAYFQPVPCEKRPETPQRSVVKTLPPLPKKPPPTYDQHMARKATLQKKNSSDSSQPSNSNSSSFESSEGDKATVGGSSTDSEQQNRMFECQWQDCSSVFQDQDEFVSHIEKQHIDQRKGEEFICLWRTCARRMPFNARYKLLMHMRVHSGEKPNKCTYTGCKKAFSRLENLKIHIRSHTGERPYSCLYQGCTKTFSNSSDRAKHQKTHQEMRPYICQVPGCAKRYTDPSSLRKHAKGCHAEKKEPGRKKIRGGVEELDPKDLNECLVIQAINISPPERTDSGLGRSPRASQLGSSTDYYPGFSTSGETNSRSGSVIPGSSNHTSPSSQHSSPRTRNDTIESEVCKMSSQRVPKLPLISSPASNPVQSYAKQLQGSSRGRPPSLAPTPRERGSSSCAVTSPKARISLSAMSKELVVDQPFALSGYYNLNQGRASSSSNAKLSPDALLHNALSRFEGVS